MMIEDLAYDTIDSKVIGPETATLGFNEQMQIYRIRVENTNPHETEDFYSKPTLKEKKMAKIIGGLAGLLSGYMASVMMYELTNGGVNHVLLAIPPVAGTLLGLLFGATKGVKMRNKAEFQKALERYNLVIQKTLTQNQT